MKSKFYLLFLLALAAFGAKAQGGWSYANFGGTSRNFPCAFAIGDYGYVSTGNTGNLAATKETWRYNPDSMVWTQMANYGGSARWGAFSFVVGGKGYLGTGRDQNGSFNDFYEYDPANNAWTSKKAFPGKPRRGAVGVGIGNYGYAGMGWDGTNYFGDWYEYDPANDAWTQKTDFPDKRNYVNGFTDGTYAYVGFGYNGARYAKDFYQYDVTNNSWTIKDSVSGAGRSAGFAFNIGTMGYVGGGSEGQYTNVKKDFYQFDPNTGAFTQLTDVPNHVEYTAAFSVKGKGYITVGDSSSTYNWKRYWRWDTTNLYVNAPSNSVCVGNSIDIKVSATDSLLTSNEFAVELSDETGSFAGTTTIIGKAKAYLDGSTINCQIPGGQTPGINYKWRITSSAPRIIGHESGPINIGPSPNYSINASGSTSICGNGSVTLWVDTVNTVGYKTHQLTIVYDATQGQSGLTGAAKVYMHSGLTDTTLQGTSWNNVVGNWGQDDGIGEMTSLGNDKWSITIDLNPYFGADYSSNLKYMSMVFRNADGSQTGKDGNGGDIFVSLYQNQLSSTFAGVAPNYVSGYQWALDGVDIAGETHGSINASGVGKYTCGYVSRCGMQSTAYISVAIGPSPTASFTVNNATQCASGNSFSFTDASTITTGTITGWAWDFGDGSTDNTQNPTHTYASTGNYNVTLVATSDAGCTSSFTSSVTVNPSPTAGIGNVGGAQCLTSNSFSFNDLSTIGSGSITAWAWDFGDGSSDNNQNTSHSYSAAGQYTVTLTVTSDLGCTSSATTTVDVNADPVASFTLSGNATRCAGNNTFDFTDASSVSTGSINSWNWDFGDGSNSTSQSPSHTYTSLGTFDVKLVVTAGVCSDTYSMTVNLVDTPTADFKTSSTGECFPQNSFTFTDASTGGSNSTISSIAWDYGDGNTGTGSQVTHSYSTPGSYNVTVKATNAAGCTNEKTMVIQVYDVPKINASAATATTFCQGGSVKLNASGAVGTYQWNLNGSPIAGATGVSTTVSASGDYTVTVVDKNGCTNTSSAVTVVVNPNVTIGSITGNLSAYQSTSENYSVTNTAGVTYTWEVTGGTIGTGQGTNAVSIDWGTGTSGTVRVYAPCSDTVTINVTLSQKPTGIGSIKESDFEVFPNPANATVTIQLKGANADWVRITDMSGKQIFTRETNGESRFTMDVSELAAGVYLVEVVSKGQVSKQKLSIVH